MFIRLFFLTLTCIHLSAGSEERGAVFQAVGNEPGWALKIMSDKKVLFLTNSGETKTYFEITEKLSDHSSTEYKTHSQNNLLYIRIENRRCQDTMAEKRYESTVYINFDGVNMKGCGEALF
ncbi:MAG: hypothetical protein ABFR02_03085 [Campylobacterota bacterium]